MLLMVSSVLVCRAQDTNDVFLKRNTSVVTRPWQEYLEQLSEQEEYEEIIAIKPMFLVMDYK